jgi:hypothetical protein
MQIFFCLTIINFTCGRKGEKRTNVCFSNSMLLFPRIAAFPPQENRKRSYEEKRIEKKKEEKANSK